MEQKKLKVCLLNDSFPPSIDGVANAVVNYATVIQKSLGEAIVATPSYPGVEDHYPFPVVRYPSLDTTKLVGYRAGYPFSARAQSRLVAFGPDVIHSHCPFVSNMAARTLREQTEVPIIFTYHTKFDIDIAHALELKLLQSAALRLMLRNIESCDEVWTVSRGAGENLRSLGYQGEYLVMENGVDFPRGAAPEAESGALRRELGLPADVPVYLFVGRMMWYKGIRVILEALSRGRKEGAKFRMVLVGDGAERREMEETARDLGIGDWCLFTGAVHDRELLRRYYSMADLFLFPSTFDTNGIVVREAAACGLGSVLIRDSCAAEGIADGRNGFLVEENGESLWALLRGLGRGQMRQVGENALRELYLSWEDSVRRAYDRYQVVIDRYRGGHTERRVEREDDLFSLMNDLCRGIQRARDLADQGRRRFKRLAGRPEEEGLDK